MRKFLFSEELGRNIIWVMLSGFFLKINARENIFGKLKLPENHYFFNLDDKELDEKYKNHNKLHYIFLDGSNEYLKDERFKKIEKKVNIYYVGKLKKFWQNIENAEPLFSNDIKILEKNIESAKKKYPIFFTKYYIKVFFTTLANIKSFKLFFNHLFGRKKFVYYGYIKPNEKLLKLFENKLGINKFDFHILFETTRNEKQLKKKIDLICLMKNQINLKVDDSKQSYLNEFILFMIRNLLCSLFKENKNFLIYDGLGGDFNFNAYEMFFGKQHVYLDLGSKVGYDRIYPRYAMLKLFNRDTINFELAENFFYKDREQSFACLYIAIKEFLEKLNFKF